MTSADDAPAASETPEAIDPRICQGPCTARLRETGKGAGAARFGDPILCGSCVSQLRNDLAEIETMSSVMQADADGHRSSTGADAAIRAHRNASTASSPSPSHDLVDELISVLRGYVVLKRPVASRLGQVARDTTELTSWLITNADKYIYDRALAGQLAADARTWHSRLEKRTKSATALVPKPLPCPACKKKGLEQERGSKVVKCRLCGLIRSIDDYEAMAADAAESLDAGAAETPPATRRKPRSTGAAA
jgi:hypothetical protein